MRYTTSSTRRGVETYDKAPSGGVVEIYYKSTEALSGSVDIRQKHWGRSGIYVKGIKLWGVGGQ